jgi:hypothetical protein
LGLWNLAQRWCHGFAPRPKALTRCSSRLLVCGHYYVDTVSTLDYSVDHPLCASQRSLAVCAEANLVVATIPRDGPAPLLRDCLDDRISDAAILHQNSPVAFGVRSPVRPLSTDCTQHEPFPGSKGDLEHRQGRNLLLKGWFLIGSQASARLARPGRPGKNRRSPTRRGIVASFGHEPLQWFPKGWRSYCSSVPAASKKSPTRGAGLRVGLLRRPPGKHHQPPSNALEGLLRRPHCIGSSRTTRTGPLYRIAVGEHLYRLSCLRYWRAGRSTNSAFTNS